MDAINIERMRTPLDVASVTDRLTAAGYTDVQMVELTGSTNADMVARRGADLPKHLSVLLAEEQHAAKGRRGRPWSAPKSSQIICTVAVHVRGMPSSALGLIPLLTGNAVARATGAKLKWPNDAQCDGRKLAGILVETIQVQPFPVLAIGIGVNYDLTEDERPVPQATSYVDEGGALSREDLTVRILVNVLEDVERFRAMGGLAATVLPRYREYSSTLGSRVRAILPGEQTLEGKAVDIGEDGSLIIETAEGRTAVSAGDVEHLR